jgi:hypothetical protein
VLHGRQIDSRGDWLWEGPPLVRNRCRRRLLSISVLRLARPLRRRRATFWRRCRLLLLLLPLGVRRHNWFLAC